jgi:hypothetical protein
MTINQKTLPWILVAAGVAYYLWKQRQAATVLDNRYPMAYRT